MKPGWAFCSWKYCCLNIHTEFIVSLFSGVDDLQKQNCRRCPVKSVKWKVKKKEICLAKPILRHPSSQCQCSNAPLPRIVNLLCYSFTIFFTIFPVQSCNPCQKICNYFIQCIISCIHDLFSQVQRIVYLLPFLQPFSNETHLNFFLHCFQNSTINFNDYQNIVFIIQSQSSSSGRGTSPKQLQRPE